MDQRDCEGNIALTLDLRWVRTISYNPLAVEPVWTRLKDPGAKLRALKAQIRSDRLNCFGLLVNWELVLVLQLWSGARGDCENRVDREEEETPVCKCLAHLPHGEPIIEARYSEPTWCYPIVDPVATQLTRSRMVGDQGVVEGVCTCIYPYVYVYTHSYIHRNETMHGWKKIWTRRVRINLLGKYRRFYLPGKNIEGGLIDSLFFAAFYRGSLALVRFPNLLDAARWSEL